MNTFRKKISLHGIVVGCIILLATFVHLLLIELGWPLTNSDEGTIGLMALHIAYQGAHPIFFYGQHYMGSWEAILAAGLFHLFSPALATLRLVTLCMFVMFLVCFYLLTRLLFTRNWAVITLLLVSLSSSFVMSTELRAIGGYAETLFFGAALFLCAAWLALTYKAPTPRGQNWRWLVYLSWGLLAGLSLWSDLLILPVLGTSGLLILLICRNELLRPLAIVCILAGLSVGAAPLIYYNMHAAPGQNSLSVLQGLRGSDQSLYTPSTLTRELQNTATISLPMITGEPFCPLSELTFIDPTSAPTPACNLAHDSWSLSYLLLLGASGVLASAGLWSAWRNRKLLYDQPVFQKRQRQQLARLLLLVSAVLSLAAFTFSSASLDGPALHSRYMICLLIATSAVFWPLWQGIQNWRSRANFAGRLLQIFCALVLSYFCILSLVGTITTFQQVPSTRASNQSDADLIQELSKLDVKHIYSSYWTCDKIAFESDEHIICAVVDRLLRPDVRTVVNRYTPYVAIVVADPRAAYVFSTDEQQFSLPENNVALLDASAPLSDLPVVFRADFIRICIDGYIIYQPNKIRHAPIYQLLSL